MNEFNLITSDNNNLTTSTNDSLSVDSSSPITVVYNNTLIYEGSSNSPIGVFYNNSSLTSILPGESKAIKCKDKFMSGDLRIKQLQSYSISPTLTNVSAVGSNPQVILEGNSVTLTYTANSGYQLPSSVSVVGASYTWTQATGTLVISNPTGNVSFSINGEAKISDLTNTSWRLNNNINFNYEWGDINAFLNGTVTDGTHTVSSNGLRVYGNTWEVPERRYLFLFTTYYENIYPGFVYENSLQKWIYRETSESEWLYTSNIVLSITGGDDVNNSNFIDWLYDNAVKL